MSTQVDFFVGALSGTFCPSPILSDSLVSMSLEDGMASHVSSSLLDLINDGLFWLIKDYGWNTVGITRRKLCSIDQRAKHNHSPKSMLYIPIIICGDIISMSGSTFLCMTPTNIPVFMLR